MIRVFLRGVWVALAILVLGAVTPAAAMDGLPAPVPPAANKVTVAIDWRDMLAEAENLVAKTPTKLNFGDSGPVFAIKSITDDYLAQLDGQPDLAAACKFTDTYVGEANAGVQLINRAMHARLGVLDGDQYTDEWGSDPADPLTPLSRFWSRLDASDLRMVRVIGMINLALARLHMVADSFYQCDSESIVDGGAYYADTTGILMLYYLVYGDDRVQGAIEDVVANRSGPVEDETRRVPQLSCADILPQGSEREARARLLTSKRWAEDADTQAGMLDLLAAVDKSESVMVKTSRIFRFFPRAADVQFSCADIWIDSEFPVSMQRLAFYDSLFGTIDMPNQQRGDIVVTRSRGIGINLSGAHLSSDLIISSSALDGAVNLDGATIADDAFLDDVRVGQFTAQTAQVGTLRIARSTVRSDLMVEGLRATALLLNDVVNDTENTLTFSAYGADIEEEVQLSGFQGFGDITMARLTAGVIRLSHVAISGQLNMWSADADGVFVNESSIPQGVMFAYGQFGAGEFNHVRTGSMTSDYAEFRTRLLISQTVVYDNVTFWNLTADDFWMNCVSVATDVSLEYAHVDQSIWLQQVQAGTVSLKDVRADGISVYAYNDEAIGAPGTTPLTEPPPPGEVTEGTEPVLTDADSAEPQPRTDAASEGTCKINSEVDVLTLRGAQADNVEITGNVKERLVLNDMVAERVSLRGERLKFSKDAALIVRNAKIGVFTVAPTGFVTDGDANSGVALDLDGSTIELLKPHSSILDEGVVQHMSANTELKLLGEKDFEQFYLQTIPDALARPVTIIEDGRPYVHKRGYDGAAFRLLRNSATSQGYPSVARAIAIQQNRNYGAQLGADQSLLAGIYWLGGAINQYGYDNARAVIILGVLWLAGLVVLNFEGLRDLALRLERRVRRWMMSRPGEPEPVDAPMPPNPSSGRMAAMFLSLDRVLPSLGLDNRFSSAEHLPDWKANLLYIQRALAFLVILFMIGGAFNFFQ